MRLTLNKQKARLRRGVLLQKVNISGSVRCHFATTPPMVTGVTGDFTGNPFKNPSFGIYVSPYVVTTYEIHRKSTGNPEVAFLDFR